MSGHVRRVCIEKLLSRRELEEYLFLKSLYARTRNEEERYQRLHDIVKARHIQWEKLQRLKEE